jgi:hypothetical protein
MVLGAGVLWWVWRHPPGPGVTPPCPSRLALGLPCPGCGTLRGTHRLLHGDLWGALQMQPLLPVMGLLALSMFLWPFWWDAWAARRPMAFRWVTVFTLTCLLGWWGLRWWVQPWI